MTKQTTGFLLATLKHPIVFVQIKQITVISRESTARASFFSYCAYQKRYANITLSREMIVSQQTTRFTMTSQALLQAKLIVSRETMNQLVRRHEYFHVKYSSIPHNCFHVKLNVYLLVIVSRKYLEPLKECEFSHENIQHATRAG